MMSSVESVKSVGGRRGGGVVTMSPSQWGRRVRSSSASLPGVSFVSTVEMRPDLWQLQMPH